jgi:pimeloyl-ACP methyl ester carboxylesterase
MRIGALQLNVAMAGDGPTVLLLHGFPDSLQLWRMVAPHLLEAGYRVIAVDQRGFGDSDAPVGRAHYSIDVLVEDLATLLRATGTHEPVHVMGHDLGAVVAWCLAMARPGLLRLAHGGGLALRANRGGRPLVAAGATRRNCGTRRRLVSGPPAACETFEPLVAVGAVHPSRGRELVCKVFAQRRQHPEIHVRGAAVGQPEQLAVVPGLRAKGVEHPQRDE